MGLANIKKKSESLGKKSNSSFLKINMYENPKMALDLISHICTSGKKIDITNFFESYEEKIIELKNKTADYTYLNTDFFNCLFSIKSNIVNDLVDNPKSVLKIAVGGGYSAGKSSFINAITSIGNLLPTGIEPVSIVNTHLNCLESAKSITINGRNIKNEIVSLNEEVLSCIQHSSKSKVYIASVLNDILIDEYNIAEENNISNLINSLAEADAINLYGAVSYDDSDMEELHIDLDVDFKVDVFV